MIQVTNLSKKFAETLVVESLNLQIKKGEIFGLLGPNAAGKTTTIRMLCNLIQPTEGDALIAGESILANSDRLKHKIGYVAQYFGLYNELSVYANLEFYTKLYKDASQAELLQLLEKYELLPFKNSPAGSLSGGYKRRLSLCCALAHDPEVLFLDEPTAGIDPVTRKALWDTFYELTQEGKTLFVTTHYMEEAQRCNRIAFLNHGKKVIEGTPREVTHSLSEYRLYKNRQPFAHALLKKLSANENIYLTNLFGDELRIFVKKGFTSDALQAVMQPYIKEPVRLEDAEANLEDVFIALTQEERR